MASPHVAGVAADVWSMNNYLTGADVKEIICEQYSDNSHKDSDGNVDYPLVDAHKAVRESYRRLLEGGKVKKEPQNGAALGWVYESDRVTAIEDVTVTPYQNGSMLEDRSTTTDEYGHFELIVPGGDYELHFSKEGYTEKILDCTVKNGEVNYFNEGIDEVISLDKEITQAERYAQIVMDNEDIWLDPLNEMYLSEYESQTCWFEDVDFDGKPEFIVGGCNMQSQGEISYYIFRFEDDKMIKIYEDYIDGENANPGISSTGNIPSHLRSPNPGFSEYSGEIIKDKNGNYRYIFPYIISYIGIGYGIAELDVEGTTLNWSFIGGYTTEPNETGLKYINSSRNNVSESKLKSSLADRFEGSSYCIAKIGTIPCTYVNEKLDSEWYEAAVGSDSGLSDAASAYVSGCYDGLSKEEKKSALIKSYNAYSIEEIGGESQLYAQILKDMKADVWKTAYQDYISQGKYKELTSGMLHGEEIGRITVDDAKFTLAYLDSDDIPELFLSGGFSVHILTIKDSKLIEIITDDEYGNIGWYGNVKIVEKEGLFLDDYQHMGTYTTPVYKMVNAKAELQSDIAYYENQDGSGAGTFYVNNEVVSKSTYLAELKKYNLNTYYTEQHPESKITGDNWTCVNTFDGYGVFHDYSIYEYIKDYL